MDATYGVVSNNYMRGGGDGYGVFETGGMNAYDFGPDLADVVAEYIAENGQGRGAGWPHLAISEHGNSGARWAQRLFRCHWALGGDMPGMSELLTSRVPRPTWATTERTRA